jgi:16S rRNA (guanine527-N7)-methyltransferase
MVFSSEFLEPSFFAKYEKLIELMLSSPHNLSSIKEFERAMTVHIEDTIIPFEGSSLSGRCIDIGSGGGIPGLVLAISFPKSNWTLLESIAKKTREIERFARDLDLP